jgi:hypothetical protein
MFMAKASGLAAGRAASRDKGGMSLFAWREGRRRRGVRSIRMRVKADDELVSGHPRLDPDRGACPKPQIDVVPPHGRIAPGSRRRACDDPRVGMPLDDFASGLEGDIIKRVRELA